MDEKKPAVQLNIYQKIVKIRESVGSLTKDMESNKFKYVKGSQILAKMQPMMDQLNVLLIPSLGDKAEITVYMDKYRDGKDWIKWRYTNDMTYTWVNADNPDEKIVSHWDAIGVQEDPSQAFGSALTYAERYFLLKFLGIPTDEVDPDAKKPDKKAKVEKPAVPTKITPDQIAILNKFYEGNQVQFDKLLANSKITSIEQMPYDLAEKKIEALNEAQKKKMENAGA